MISFQDIVGQGEAVERLQRTMTGSRMPHALIFAGPAGVGRRTAATALAAVLLCHGEKGDRHLFGTTEKEPVPIFACGQCTSCRMMSAGTHPDFQLVYKELAAYHEDAGVRSRVMQDLGIDVIRDFLIAPACHTAAGGRGKVFVVIEAELMSAAAQNALLKTLEEPPEGVTIILICRRPEQLLPTTLSRCAMIRFNLLGRDFVAAKLTEQGVDADEARFWAALTGGSLGRSMDLAARDLYETKQEIVRRLGALGPAGDAEFAEHLKKTMESLSKAAVAEAKKVDGPPLSATLANRQASAAMLEIIATVFEDAMALATGADRTCVHADQPESIRATAAGFSPRQLCEIIEQLAEYERLLWRNVNPKTVWDNVVITCASAAPLRV